MELWQESGPKKMLSDALSFHSDLYSLPHRCNNFFFRRKQRFVRIPLKGEKMVGG
jgi:hypothetical protein